MVKIGSSLVDTTTDALQKEIPRRKKVAPFLSHQEKEDAAVHTKRNI